jgi:hypothetical protein
MIFTSLKSGKDRRGARMHLRQKNKKWEISKISTVSTGDQKKKTGVM